MFLNTFSSFCVVVFCLLPWTESGQTRLHCSLPCFVFVTVDRTWTDTPSLFCSLLCFFYRGQNLDRHTFIVLFLVFCSRELTPTVKARVVFLCYTWQPRTSMWTVSLCWSKLVQTLMLKGPPQCELLLLCLSVCWTDWRAD